MATTNLSYYDKETIPNAKKFRFGIVVSEWNTSITEGLFQGAQATLVECGVALSNIVRWDVPGSFELIYGSKKMQKCDVDVVIAIGCVIQGETKHFDFVCQGLTQGVMDVMLKFNKPVSFCVLTDLNKQQSLDRSGGKHGNKGVECAVALLQMIKLQK